MQRLSACVVLFFLGLGTVQGGDDGFLPMFSGKDLKGWVNVNCAPGTFYVKDDMIITTGIPVGFLRTDRQYENFIMEFDWFHAPSPKGSVGNSGLFVWGDPLPAVGSGYTRGIEVQVLVNLTYKDKKTGEITATSQGDLFSIWGATCKPDRPHPIGWLRCLPSENRCKGEYEWNHYRVEAKDGILKLAVNGKVVSGVSACRPRKGYLALESEGSECRFKNLKIKELPSSNPSPEEIAEVAQGHKNLYTGLDLSGWKADEETKKHWKPRDWILHYDGKGKPLETEQEYGDAEFIADFSFPKKESAPLEFIIRKGKGRLGEQGLLNLTLTPDGKYKVGTATGTQSGKIKGLKSAGQWNRLRAMCQALPTENLTRIRLTVNGEDVANDRISAPPGTGAFLLRPEGEMNFGNLFVRELKK